MDAEAWMLCGLCLLGLAWPSGTRASRGIGDFQEGVRVFVRVFFRLFFESAAWFAFVVSSVLLCDPAIAAKVSVWRVAALALAGCAVARLVRWVNAAAAEVWAGRGADGLAFADNACEGCGFGMPLPESHGKPCPRCGRRVPSWRRERHATSAVMCHKCGSEGSGKFCDECGAKMPAFKRDE